MKGKIESIELVEIVSYVTFIDYCARNIRRLARGEVTRRDRVNTFSNWLPGTELNDYALEIPKISVVFFGNVRCEEHNRKSDSRALSYFYRCWSTETNIFLGEDDIK
jgi:hypothetical protein